MVNVKIGHNASAYLTAPLQRLNGIIHVKCFARTRCTDAFSRWQLPRASSSGCPRGWRAWTGVEGNVSWRHTLKAKLRSLQLSIDRGEPPQGFKESGLMRSCLKRIL